LAFNDQDGVDGGQQLHAQVIGFERVVKLQDGDRVGQSVHAAIETGTYSKAGRRFMSIQRVSGSYEAQL